MSAASSRPAIKAPYAYRNIGVDGSLVGFQRPFPGFREIHRFEPSLWGGNHDASSLIVDIQYVTFVVGETGYAYGFVYRVRRKNDALGATACDVFVDFWNSKTGKWTLAQSLKTGVRLSPEFDAANGKLMSVSVWGRFVFVYLEDAEPIMFWVKEDLTGPSYDFTLISDTGPGKVPNLKSPINAVTLGTIITLDVADRPGNAQVDVIEFPPNDGSLSALVDNSHKQYTESATLSKLKPGDYTFAYFLYDSRTGRRSALSRVAQVTSDLFDPDTTGPLEARQLYAVMEITYDSAKYDQAYVYRSVRVQGAGGTYVGAILHLDRILTLSEYATLNNPLTPSTVKQSLYWFDLEDKVLAFQSTYNENVQFDEDLPKGGASVLYEGVMLVSSIGTPSVSSSENNRITDATRGTGELRWSSLTDGSPELFPPGNVYYPNLTSNEILVMEIVGANVIGFSRDRQYLIRKEGGFIKVVEMHEGYGVVNARACDTVGSYIYFVSNNGLKAVDSNGQLDDVPVLNEFFLDKWRRDERTLSMAFDPTLACLFILNKNRAESLCVWMNTSRVSMLMDTPFQQVGRCAWPDNYVHNAGLLSNPADLGSSNSTYANPLVERAFFVQNAPKNSASDQVPNFQFRVFMVDYLRERIKEAGSKTGQPDRCVLPNTADAFFSVATAFNSGSALSITTTGKYLSGTLWGARLYVVKSASPAMLGKSAVIRTTTSAGSTITLTTASASALYGLAVGDVVGISPVYFELQTHPLPYVIDMAGGNEQQLVADYFRVRQISTIGCSFTDVVGLTEMEDVNVARFRGLAFKGSDPLPIAVADTWDDGGALKQSVADHEGVYYAVFGKGSSNSEAYYGVQGTYLTPGVRIIVPDLDFRLFCVTVEGAIQETTTTQRR